MSNCPFCNPNPTAKAVVGKDKPSLWRSGAGYVRTALRGLRWLLPATVIALLPKCPFCIVGYIAVFTGIGISVTTARWLQISTLAVCSTMLMWFIYNQRRRFIK